MTHPLILLSSLLSVQAAELIEENAGTFSWITQATCAPAESLAADEPTPVSIARLHRDVEAVLAEREAPAMQCQNVRIEAQFFTQDGDLYSGSLAVDRDTRSRVWIERVDGVDHSGFDGQSVVAIGRFYWLCAFARETDWPGPCSHAGVQGLVLENVDIRFADEQREVTP